MALNPLALSRLLGMMKPGQSIASLGYPDIIYPPDMLRDALGDKLLQLKYRNDSRAICARHGLKYREIPDAESLFELFGCTLDVFDIVEERGCEIVLDLNYPFPANACEQFDYVLDVGTLEHCFNVAQALINVAALAKVGGVVIHDNPMNAGNHGFYGINPTLYHDFYTDNGFEIVEAGLTDIAGSFLALTPWKRFVFTKQEVNTFVIARRLAVQDFVFPTQHKYRPKEEKIGKDRGQDRDGGPDAGSVRGVGGLQHVEAAEG